MSEQTLDFSKGGSATASGSDVQRTHQTAKRTLVSKLVSITDPDEKEKLKNSYSNIRLSLFDKLEIEKLRRKLALRTSTETIRWLRETYNEAQDSTPTPILTPELLNEPQGTPLVLCGRPGSGKSLALKRLVPHVERVILFDLADEHGEIPKKMSLEGLLAYKKWSKGAQLKFCPSQNSHELGTLETRTLIEFLNRTKYDGRYKNWTVCIEEAHRIYRHPAAISLILEGRKYFKRILVVSADHNLFPACMPVRPSPLNELLGT